VNRATSKALGKLGLRGAGCPNNAGGFHVTAPINNWQLGYLIRAGFTEEQLKRYVCCRMCDRMGPPELVRARPEATP
jgi:hypothetical protein